MTATPFPFDPDLPRPGLVGEENNVIATGVDLVQQAKDNGKALAQFKSVCRARGVNVALDNTWGAGLAFAPFDFNGSGQGVDISVQALTKYPKPVQEGAARTVPLQRLGRPEEHAWLVAYLASPAGDYYSGAIFTLDGARDNWFGPWPPPGLSDETGKPLAEERRPKPG